MDKNRNRTDLLAAGRKKLQQYRQKKDNKGSSSKSSGKAGKSGRDAQHYAADGEGSKQDVENTAALSESNNNRVDSEGTDISVASDEFSSKAGISEVSTLAAVALIPSEDSGLDQVKLNQSGNEGHQSGSESPTMVFEDAKDSMQSDSDPINLREKSMDLDTFVPTDFSSNWPDGGEQVTDVGAMQDGGPSGGNQIYSGFSGTPARDNPMAGDSVNDPGEIQSETHLATVENEGSGNDVYSMPKPEVDSPSLAQLKVNVYDDASGFIALKRNLGSAEMLMRKLENEIVGLHSHTSSLSKNPIKVGSPRVSRLIQAFEVKPHVDEQDPEKPPSSEHQTTEALYMRTKMVTDNLRLLLEELVNDAENASEFCRAVQMKLCNDAANLDRTKYSSLSNYADQVEETNIELMVQYEVMRLHSWETVARENELLNLCDALQTKEVILTSENGQLGEKLNDLNIKISELQSQLDGIYRDSDEKVASISQKLQTLQAEVVDGESILEEEWKSAFAQVVHTISELDSTVETNGNLFATGGSNTDVVGQVTSSVHGACKLIDDLRGQLEASHSNRQEILDRSNMALNTLHKLYKEIDELVITFGHRQDKAQNFLEDDVLHLLHSDVSSTLLNQLKDLLGERLQLLSANQQLNEELMTKAREIDELDKKCLKSDTIVKLVEEIEHSVMLGVAEKNSNEPASHLESLIHLLVQKYKEADQCLSLSKSLEMQLSDREGQLDHLHLVLGQYENENLVLKQSLKSTEENVIVLGTELKEKVAELEQSEQRVLSLREKLSIAVSKGKGLISHRDGLKQSLAETSKELEKCSQDLLSKDARLHELETKLRVYSEAGERMEALESELSYIRNSATALRESFLLKDSALQRIEEVLEDIELPEHFHSGNTIEKVEWLAKSIGGQSLPPGSWDQRSSVGGGSYSDVGFVGVEGLKDDMQPNHDSGDDLRRRYEELENKFYGLAEQNEMLEQSLMDMNNLVQRWEGVLNNVAMPPQFRSMEPEDKIQWLETELSQAQDHSYSLQKKIDSFETFCESLVADVEDSQRRVFELVAALQLVCVEKEIISLELEISSHENEELSRKNANLKITDENLQYEVSVFQEEKLRAQEDTHRTNDVIGKLQELVCDALQDSSTEDMIHGREGIIYLEEMLKKLLKKYDTLTSHTSRELDEPDVLTLKKKMEESAAECVILKEERDGYMLKNQSLLHEVEELEMKFKELHELLIQEELKSASMTETLSKKLEGSIGELKILHEEKDRFEMNNQSLLSEIEALEMKRTELQELLNQESLKSTSLAETLKNVQNSMNELTILKDEKNRLVQSNQSLLRAVDEQEMKRRELQELLNQEELKSSSLAETLKNMQDAMNESMISKDEKDRLVQSNQSLLCAVEELEMQKKELRELLNQEELKSVSLAETLKNVQDSVDDLTILKDEKDRLVQNNQSLLRAVEELEIRKKELQELLNQEELKSASLADTLKNVQDSTNDLMILKEERDRYEMNNQSLLSEIEVLEMKKKELQELLDQEELKSASLAETLKNVQDSVNQLTILKDEKDSLVQSNQSLLCAVEELDMQRKELQELLNQEELKSTSLAETLKYVEDLMNELLILKGEKDMLVQSNQSLLHSVEELEMKTKELQELLNQEELKSASSAEILKNVQDSMDELMILKNEKDKLVQNNQSLLHSVEELEMKKKELQELLNQEELKSASLAEILKNMQDSMNELMILKDEKDKLVQNNQSLLHSAEELEMRKKELQELLHQEEQKSNSLREKLNVAVRKGKSLVQQRDGMKQMIEELNAEVGRLKAETEHTAKAISEHEEQTSYLLTAQERLQVLESEKVLLTDRLEETELYLHEKDSRWNRMMAALETIDLGHEFHSGNPDERMKEIGKYLTDLHTRMNSLVQESRKSKRAAELLLTELNEVQERNDGLQDELEKAGHELLELSREKDLAEKAKHEAFAQIEKLSHTQSEEKDNLLNEIMVLRSGVNSMREDLSAIERELGDVLSKDFQFLQNLKSVMKSFLEVGGTPDFGALFPDMLSRGAKSIKSENKVFITEIDSFWELLYSHSQSLQEEASQLSEVLMNVQRGYTSHKEACESMKKDVQKLEFFEKEKESELHILQGNMSLLYETCVSAISEIEKWKDHISENTLASRPPEKRISQIPIEGWNSSANEISIVNEESIRSTRDKLLLLIRDFIHMQSDLVEVGQSEMKSTISNLQKELQERDAQRERVCVELVNQIKEAETNSKNYLHELQQVKTQLHNSQKQLSVMEEEHKVLEQRIKELQDQETDSKDLQLRVNSLTDELTAKMQEIEALMQALDAEESEMEDLTNKVASLETELQQKNKDLENLETSRAKALKKLSVTVSKFDELHYFSESLLSEVEKLQSQLQERDAEISFLRQEVTKCTNDALTVTELRKKSSHEVHGLLSWLDSLISQTQRQDLMSDESKSQPVNEYKESLQKKIMDLVLELESLRLETQKSDILLQKERRKVEDLTQKERYLKDSLHEKESQLVQLQEAGDSSRAVTAPSEIVEVEPRSKKWNSPGNITPQVRSLRKTNNDYVAIAVDVDHSNNQLEDDDDKAHGFKSLTTSKFVPRFTRPVSDFVDGLWVSCDRTLMRQPALRLGLILYWAVVHALLATFVV